MSDAVFGVYSRRRSTLTGNLTARPSSVSETAPSRQNFSQLRTVINCWLLIISHKSAVPKFFVGSQPWSKATFSYW